MARPFNARRRRENAAFLRLLSRTGNARLAARESGLHRATLEKRRRRDPAFAAAWAAALVAAQATLTAAARAAERPASRRKRSAPPPQAAADDALRTAGGEPVLTRTRNGALQLRRAAPDLMSAAALRRLLQALEGGASLREAARAVGLAHTSLLARCRRDPVFAAEVIALQDMAHHRLQWEHSQRSMVAPADLFFADLPMPPMTVQQAMHQLTLHRQVRGGAPLRRPPIPRPLSHYAAGIIAKLEAVERARHHSETGSWRYPGEERQGPLLGPIAGGGALPEPRRKRPG